MKFCNSATAKKQTYNYVTSFHTKAKYEYQYLLYEKLSSTAFAL